jgi:Na+/H+ antiporter NhaD/arsenite permease-like protein
VSFLLLFIFFIGYCCIVLEEWLTLDKTVPALLMGVLCWVGIAFLDEGDSHYNAALSEHIGEISEILLFVLGAMTIVELIDLHKGFDLIRNRLPTKSPTALLWAVALLTFILSSILDNLTTALVMTSVLLKMMDDEEQRKYMAGIIIIAANAGGAWSPMGDVTTTMLWMDDRVTAWGLVVNGLLPALVCMLVPTLIATWRLRKQTINCHQLNKIQAEEEEKIYGSKIVFFTGVGSLIFVPIFKITTGLPPYMGMLLGLGVCWLVGEILDTNREHDDRDRYTVHRALQRIEISSLLFFCGILLAVAALQHINILTAAAGEIAHFLPNVKATIFGIGLLSAVVDNVPLVAAVMGMYSPAEYATDNQLWQFLAYCAGTGGSILIIGSAAGVAVMATEKISFGWYLRHIAWLALLGYIAGALIF